VEWDWTRWSGSQYPTSRAAGSNGQCTRVNWALPPRLGDVDDLFAPPDHEWQRVSIRLRDLRRILILGGCGVLALATGVPILIFTGLWWVVVLILIVFVCLAGWGWFWAARNQANWGYAEDADELIVTCGVAFKRLVAIPYGRMQFVDVSAGPLDRVFGIATVTLHTASTETAADIPGLPADEATRLRNRLTELGEAHGAGL